jgi:hypothetical protein
MVAVVRMAVMVMTAGVRIIAPVTIMTAAVPMAAGIRIIAPMAVMTGIMPAAVRMPPSVVQDSQEINNGNPYPKNGQGGIEDK